MIWDGSNTLLLKKYAQVFFLGKNRQLRYSQVNKSSPKEHGEYLWKLFAEWLSLFLQIRATFVSTKWGRIITNRDSYYKFAQIYYKLVQLLQIGAIIINQCTTHGESSGPNFIKIEDYIYFEMNIFHNILQDNVHEQVFS